MWRQSVVEIRGGDMRRTTIALSLLLFSFSLSACATLFDGTSQVVSFNSEPNRVKVFINGVQIGTTPLSTQISRKRSTIVLARKEGYQDQQMVLQTKLNNYFWGNIICIICGGVFGSTTDYVSDAMVEYAPNNYYFSLDPIKISEAEQNRLSYEKKVRNFILLNHANLTSDLAKGGGEYLSSLYSMLAITDSRRSEMLKRLRVISSSNHEPPSFVEAVLNEFLRG